MKNHAPFYSFIRYVIAIVAICIGSTPLTVSAVDIQFYRSNDILYYDGLSGRACTTVGSSYSTPTDLPVLTGSDNAEKIWNFLKADGFSDEQVAGFMGNIKQESGYDPDLTESNGVGYGIIQWSYTRRDALEAAAAEKGIPVSDLGFQLAYLKQEASSPPLYNWRNLFQNFGVSASDNVWDSMKKMGNIERATTFFHDSFERSGDYENYGGIQHRVKYANEAYEQFTGRSAGSGSSGSANCTAEGSGDLIATLLEYAHPDYHPNNFSGPVPPPKPAYLAAATKLDNEGKWVGGGKLEIGIPGIDCGGFVSILLTQSGFEPDYNFGLDYERGASNQEWGQLPWAQRYWKYLGRGGQLGGENDEQERGSLNLEPGDVAYSNGHTFIYVGNVSGFNSLYASASYAWWRAPMAAGSWDGGFESATNPDYVWYGRRDETPQIPYGSTRITDAPPQPSPYTNPGGGVY